MRIPSIAKPAYNLSFAGTLSLAILLFIIPPSVVVANGKLSSRLSAVVNSLGAEETVLAWVYFSDKGYAYDSGRRSIPNSVVSDAALRRRMKVRGVQGLVDEADLPVNGGYLRQIESRAIHIRQRSKWFNSVSVVATASQLRAISELPFVKEIDLVAQFKRSKETESGNPEAVPFTRPSFTNAGTFDYGPSSAQVELINVPAVHNTGNYGQGVIVGVFDNGFRLPNHEAFDSLDILATYDFVDHKVSVVPNNPSVSFGFHGVLTLSNIAGFKEGQLIGPAFGATYVLARTENDSSETPIEEDNWVAAIEWAESLGVQVTSTSLGYLFYDPPYSSYSWESMDGNTALITRAANRAAANGVVVVNSAGNNGSHPDHNTLNAPADGIGVLTIGSINPDGTRSSFSSVGPTVDGRIKPDLMAPGGSVYCASYTNPTGYVYSGGTSHACPLAAGVAALYLHAHPGATPTQVLMALRNTASIASTPDNLNGWGTIDAAAAIAFSPTIPASYTLHQNYPNPFNASTSITFDLPEPAGVEIAIYDALGRHVRTISAGTLPAGSGTSPIVWDGKNNAGLQTASGVYFYRLTAKGASGRSILQSRAMVLLR